MLVPKLELGNEKTKKIREQWSLTFCPSLARRTKVTQFWGQEN